MRRKNTKQGDNKKPGEPTLLNDLPDPLIKMIISKSSEHSKDRLAQVSTRFNQTTQETSQCFLLFRKTTEANPVTFLNNDQNELLFGEIFPTEAAAQESLEDEAVMSPAIVELNISITNLNFFKKSAAVEQIAKHVTNIAGIPVLFKNNRFVKK